MNGQTSKCKFIKLCFASVMLSYASLMAAPTAAYQLILGEDHKVAMKTVSESYVRQSRAVLFDAKLLAISSPLKTGDTVSLNLLSNVTYFIVIDSVTRDQFGSFSLLGTIAGAKLSSVNITANDGAIIGTVQDLAKNKLYRIRSIGNKSAHYVLDYDVEKMPSKWDLPAIEPPMVPNKEGSP